MISWKICQSSLCACCHDNKISANGLHVTSYSGRRTFLVSMHQLISSYIWTMKAFASPLILYLLYLLVRGWSHWFQWRSPIPIRHCSSRLRTWTGLRPWPTRLSNEASRLQAVSSLTVFSSVNRLRLETLKWPQTPVESQGKVLTLSLLLMNPSLGCSPDNHSCLMAHIHLHHLQQFLEKLLKLFI